MTALEELPDAGEIIEALLAQITDLETQLQAEREVSDHWRTRAQQADRRVAQLETERFA